MLVAGSTTASFGEENNTWLEVSAAWVTIILSSISTLGRLWVRKSRGTGIKFDDAFMVLGWLGALGASIIAIRHPPRKHVFEYPLETIQTFSKNAYAFTILYLVCINSIKLSILLLYARLFTTRGFVLVVTVVFIFVLLWGIASTTVAAVQCIPISKLWDLTISGKCLDRIIVGYWIAGISVFTNVLVLILPITVIVNLRLPRCRKVALLTVFLLGGLSCFAAIGRIFFISDLGSPDVTYALTTLGAISLLETLFSVLCGNLPVLYPLLADAWYRMRGVREITNHRNPHSRQGSANPVFARPPTTGQGVPYAGPWANMRTNNKGCSQQLFEVASHRSSDGSNKWGSNTIKSPNSMNDHRGESWGTTTRIESPAPPASPYNFHYPTVHYHQHQNSQPGNDAPQNQNVQQNEQHQLQNPKLYAELPTLPPAAMTAEKGP